MTQRLSSPRSTLLLFYGILLLLLLSSPTVNATEATTSTTTTEDTQKKKNDDPYALYSLPPFTVTFTSSYTLAGLPTDPDERGTLLASTLHQPLKIITGEFLMESFRIAMATPNKNATKALQNRMDSFLTLDLQVAVQSVHHLELSPAVDGGTTNDNNNDNNIRRDLQQQQDFPHGSITSSRAQQRSPDLLLQFQADFFITAAFLEDSSSHNDDISSDQISNTMGGWMQESFDQDKPYYFTSLQNSDNGVLKNLEQLHIETDSQAVFDPSTVGGSGSSTSTTTDSGTNTEDTTTSTDTNQEEAAAAAAAPTTSATAETKSKATGWTKSEKTFFTVLVSVSTLSIAGLLLAISHYTKRGERQAAAAANRSGHNHYDEEEIIGGRHADEIMEVLQASDRYLATHRPDLLAKYGGSGSNHSNGNGTPIIPVAVEPQDPATTSTNAPPERRYVTPTNPFQYLYGAAYFHKERHAVQQERAHRRPTPDPMDNVELQEPVPDDELPHDDIEVSGFLQSWFQRVVGRRVVAPPSSSMNMEQQQQQEQLVVEEGGYYNDNENPTANNTSGVAEEYGELACEQDPSGYNFAFSDFPRQDGTPCLIYEETLDEDEEEQYLAAAANNNNNKLNYSTSSFGMQDNPEDGNYNSVHDPLTDDEFQRALSQHNDDHQASYYYYNNNHYNSNSSLEYPPQQRHGHDSDSVTETTADGTESLLDTSEEAAILKEAEGEEDPSKFTDKLERLVAIRHRHYEKQRIVEKHREQRRQERAKQRAAQQQEEMQKRDLLLRRHSMELDIQALEASLHNQASSAVHQNGNGTLLKPPSSTSKVTPTSTTSSNSGNGATHNVQGSWHQSPEQLWTVKKPKLHRRTSSEADAGNSGGGVHSPPSSGGIKSNRSMDAEVDDTAKYGAETAAVGPTTTEAATTTTTTTNKNTIQDESNMAKENNGRMVQSARKHPRSDVFRPIEPRDMGVVSPTSSMTETGSSTAPSSCGDGSHSTARSTPPLMMGSNSVRDGTSARKKKRPISSASLALAQGFKARGRSMSFSNVEEKKVDDAMAGNKGYDKTIDGGNSGKQPLPPSHQLPRRANSMNRHRRSNSSSPAEDLSVHGIYAQFV